MPPWACLPGRRLGPLHRVLPRIWPYLAKNQKWSGRQKYSAGAGAGAGDGDGDGASAGAGAGELSAAVVASLGTGDEAAQECATPCHPSDNTSFKRQNAKQAYCPLREGTGERSAAINKNSDHATFVSEGSVAAGDGGALSANAVAGGSLLTSATRGQTSIVRVQALVWRWLAQRVARWERGWRCGPQLSLELVALVRVQCLLLFWPWHLISYTCKRCNRPV